MIGGAIAIVLLLATPQQSAESGEVGKKHQSPQQQPHKAAPSAVTYQVLAGKGHDGAYDKATTGGDPAHGWTRQDLIQTATALFTALYFGATVWILIEMRGANRRAQRAAARSLWLTRKSNQLTRESLNFTRDSFQIAHRPYLHVESFEVATQSIDPRQLPPDAIAQEVRVTARLRNTGSTPANHVMSWAKLFRQPKNNECDPRWLTPDTPDHRTPMFSLAPTASYEPHWSPLLDYRGLTDDASTALYFGAVVVYRDDFKQWHSYRFLYRYDAGTGQWVEYRDARDIGSHLTDPWLKGRLEQSLGKDEVG